MFNRHFDPFNLLVDENSKTIVVLNPKVMTSFTRRLFRGGWRLFRGPVDPSQGRYPWEARARQFPLLSPAAYLRLAVAPDDFVAFALVRNPYLRTYSAWRDKFFDPHIRGGGDERAYPRSMRGGELRGFRRFATRHRLPGGEANTLVPFETFLACISRQRVGRRNHHWDVQSQVIQARHFRFRRVYRMEDERHDFFRNAFGRMGFDPDWIEARLSTKINSSSAITAALHLDIGCCAHTTMQSIFADDFERFGYDPHQTTAIGATADRSATAAE